MNKKKKAIACVVILFIFLSFGVVYIFTELYTESDIPVIKINESGKFKEDYESVNNKELDNGKVVRELNIPKNNPFKYKTAEEIVEAIKKKETFVVYFGFNDCPWCRSIVNNLIDAANNKHVKSIYYVDVKEIRDKYELDQNNKLVRVNDGTEAYNELITLMGNVLKDYSPLSYKNAKNKTIEVKIDEKRIYAPNVVVVKNGNAVALESGIAEALTDPYMELTDDINCESRHKFECLLDKLSSDDEFCSAKEKIC